MSLAIHLGRSAALARNGVLWRLLLYSKLPIALFALLVLASLGLAVSFATNGAIAGIFSCVLVVAAFYCGRTSVQTQTGGSRSGEQGITSSRFDSLADASPIGIFLNDRDGLCTYTNPRWQEISGITYEDSLGDNWSQMIHPKDRDDVFTEWNATIIAGREFSSEFRIVKPSGEVRWVRSCAARVLRSGNDSISYIGTTEDITDRRLLEAQLNLAKERLDLAMRGTQDGLWDWDVVTNELFFSERFCELIGYTQQELPAVLATFEELLHPDDKTRIIALIRHHLETQEPYDVEFQLLTKSDGYRWFSAGGQAEWDEDGRARRMSGSIRDISDRREAEHHLRLTEACIAHSNELAFRVDVEGRITYANLAACESLGYALEDLTTKYIWDINIGMTEQRWSDNWHRKNEHEAIVFNSEYRKRDGSSFPVEVTSTLIHLDGKKFAFGYVRDISERIAAEHTKDSYTRALLRSNQELEQFAYIASHDLQEPLRKIQAFGDRLKASSADALGTKGLDYLERMRSSAQRMQTLIDDLLSFSRVTSGGRDFKPTNLNDIARIVVEDLEVRLEQTNGTIVLCDLPTIEGDATQLRQLLQNLLANALKFHAPDRPPEISIKAEIIDGVAIDGSGVQHVAISIADNGIGFDEKYVDKIFAPFQRLHGRGDYEGTGIGLAVSRKIVERHGGTLSASSEVGVGSTFNIDLPMTHADNSGLVVPPSLAR